MTPQDIEAQLSYAYLHAVASHAGIACQEANRAHDNLGIDACLTLRRDFGEDAPLKDITLHIQLKATTKEPAERDDTLSYFLDDISEYERLRHPSALPARLLGVLFLPRESESWVSHDVERLVVRQCAYWVCLVGAAHSDNARGQTVYLPKSQALSPMGLVELFRRVARQEQLRYGT